MSGTMHRKSDIQMDSWIDRVLPTILRPYGRLARLDRPIGTWLLLLPCWWGVTLASDGWPDPVLLGLFALGSLAMRGAGCTFNDLADRNYDARVARTASRPIASGAVTVRQAVVFLVFQLAVGLVVVVNFDTFTIQLAVASLALVALYPFAKRITDWPQAVLGLTFNWGVLVGWSAVAGTLSPLPVIVYVAAVFWTLGYDTIYAHQDKLDDIEIGIRSSAIRLGSRTKPALVGFYGLMVGLLAVAGLEARLEGVFWVGLTLTTAHLAWQVKRVRIDSPETCLAVFRSNRDTGLIVLASILFGRMMA